MAEYYRYQKLERYVGGQPTGEYKKGDLIDIRDYNSQEDCEHNAQYRWADNGTTICEGYSLYKQERLEKSYDGGQTWSISLPEQLRLGEMLEQWSTECGWQILERWLSTGETMCDESILMREFKKQVSYDMGSTWNDSIPLETRWEASGTSIQCLLQTEPVTYRYTANHSEFTGMSHDATVHIGGIHPGCSLIAVDWGDGTDETIQQVAPLNITNSTTVGQSYNVINLIQSGDFYDYVASREAVGEAVSSNINDWAFSTEYNNITLFYHDQQNDLWYLGTKHQIGYKYYTTFNTTTGALRAKDAFTENWSPQNLTHTFQQDGTYDIKVYGMVQKVGPLMVPELRYCSNGLKLGTLSESGDTDYQYNLDKGSILNDRQIDPTYNGSKTFNTTRDWEASDKYEITSWGSTEQKVSVDGNAYEYELTTSSTPPSDFGVNRAEFRREGLTEQYLFTIRIAVINNAFPDEVSSTNVSTYHTNYDQAWCYNISDNHSDALKSISKFWSDTSWVGHLSNMTNLPSNLFRYSTMLYNSTFQDTWITGIPANFYKYTSQKAFRRTFYNCVYLTTIGAGCLGGDTNNMGNLTFDIDLEYDGLPDSHSEYYINTSSQQKTTKVQPYFFEGQTNKSFHTIKGISDNAIVDSGYNYGYIKEEEITLSINKNTELLSCVETFRNCISLATIQGSILNGETWNTIGMFQSCISLTGAPQLSFAPYAGPVSYVYFKLGADIRYNSKNLQNEIWAARMFENCVSLTTPFNFANISTQDPMRLDLLDTYRNCKLLTSINWSFRSTNYIKMEYTFAWSGLTSVTLNNVDEATYTCAYCDNLITSHFTGSLASFTFAFCENLAAVSGAIIDKAYYTYAWSGVTSVPDGLISSCIATIGTFMHCDSLVNIQGTRIGTYPYLTFAQCKNLDADDYRDMYLLYRFTDSSQVVEGGYRWTMAFAGCNNTQNLTAKWGGPCNYGGTARTIICQSDIGATEQTTVEVQYNGDGAVFNQTEIRDLITAGIYLGPYNIPTQHMQYSGGGDMTPLFYGLYCFVSGMEWTPALYGYESTQLNDLQLHYFYGSGSVQHTVFITHTNAATEHRGYFQWDESRLIDKDGINLNSDMHYELFKRFIIPTEDFHTTNAYGQTFVTYYLRDKQDFLDLLDNWTTTSKLGAFQKYSSIANWIPSNLLTLWAGTTDVRRTFASTGYWEYNQIPKLWDISTISNANLEYAFNYCRVSQATYDQIHADAYASRGPAIYNQNWAQFMGFVVQS